MGSIFVDMSRRIPDIIEPHSWECQFFFLQQTSRMKTILTPIISSHVRHYQCHSLVTEISMDLRDLRDLFSIDSVETCLPILRVTVSPQSLHTGTVRNSRRSHPSPIHFPKAQLPLKILAVLNSTWSITDSPWCLTIHSKYESRSKD